MNQAPQWIDRYAIDRLLGTGAWGVVYRAVDPNLGRPVAVKLLAAARPGTSAAKRFQREVEALATLDHPNLVRIHASGVWQDRPYYVMELVEGRSLAERLNEGQLPPSEAVACARDLADALAHVHAAEMLHRDVKPSNVLLDADDRPLLTDFGLVKDLSGSSSLTRSGAMLGTPGFWSPEQARGALRELSPATDVYGLGATLYMMLTGEPPIDAGGGISAVVAAQERPPTRPSAHNPAVDAPLDALVLRCLAKAPADRYEDGAALRDDLDRWLNGTLTAPRARGPLAVLVAVCLLIVVGGIAFAVSQSGPNPSPVAKTTAEASPAPKATAVADAPLAWPWTTDPVPLVVRRRRTGEGFHSLLEWQVTMRATRITEREVHLDMTIDRLRLAFKINDASLVDADSGRADAVGPGKHLRAYNGQVMGLRVATTTGEVLGVPKPLPKLDLGTSALQNDTLLGQPLQLLDSVFSGVDAKHSWELVFEHFPPRPAESWRIKNDGWVLDAHVMFARRFRREGARAVFEGRIDRRIAPNPRFQAQPVEHRGAPMKGYVEPGRWRYKAEIDLPSTERNAEAYHEVIELSRRR